MGRTLTSDLPSEVGKKVTVKGWVHSRRDHGKLIFLDLRDRRGLAQIVITPKSPAYGEAQKLRSEYVVLISGTVNQRPEAMVNPNIPSGTVEVSAEMIEILNPAETAPFELDDTGAVNEELRLKYRYLDLRTARMQGNLRLRAQVVKFIRDWLTDQDFVEVETPILTKGTPEGAREYIVPARLNPGHFYVLPQSPQQFKQLLMVAGLERYFQIARCFRDEDQRGDRQPEFTQLDLEMSFVSQEDVLQLTEKLLTDMVKQLFPKHHLTAAPWPRLAYQDSMKHHGSDKPDLRKDKNDRQELAFAWVVDVPMFEKDREGRLTTAHHPFTMPHEDDLDLIESDPLKVRAYSYDIVLNGYEVGSGSIRIHRSDIQKRIFKALGLSMEEIELRFGHMLKAFTYGAPPHGGIAPGIDRLVMILADEPNIREVIAFPKTGDGRDPMMGAPAPVADAQLKEVGIAVVKRTKQE